MENRILVIGKVGSVCYREGFAELFVCGEFWVVSDPEADKALAARRSTPPREIEIVEVDGTWKSRVVRIVPVVVVKKRGTVKALRDPDPAAVSLNMVQVTLAGEDGAWMVPNQDGLRLRAEVEIVAIDGGPDTVRVVR